MADGGITEAAILAAMAGGSTAAAAAPAVTAATLTAAELAAAAATTTAAAGSVAAAAAPEIVAASVAPTIAASAAAAAPEVVATSLLPEVAAATVPEAVTAATVPESLLLATTEAVPEATTGLLGTAAEADIGFGAGNLAPGFAGYGELPVGTSLPATTPIGTAPYPGTGLLDQLGSWWSTSSTGDKLKAGGELLSTAGTAKAAVPQEQGPNRTKTIAQGKVGQPSGGERALAEIVEAMLKRKDAYNKGRLGGAPVLYQPRGLLG